MARVRRRDTLTELDRQTIALGLALLVWAAGEEGVIQNAVNVAQKLALLTPMLGALVSLDSAVEPGERVHIEWDAWLKGQAEDPTDTKPS